jgi:gluconolactonase
MTKINFKPKNPKNLFSPKMKNLLIFLLISLGLNFSLKAQEIRHLAIGKPSAIIDLKTQSGIDLVKTAWKFKAAEVVKADFNAPGPKGEDKLALYPTGKKIQTNDISPKAGNKDFDDNSWEVLKPTELEQRKGNGILSFVWYRLNVTIPQKINDLEVNGSTIVFEIVLDDYSEIWVNGQLNKTFGQAEGGAISGYNTRNRVFLTHNAQAGQQFQIAILGTNGPIADLPDNYIWIRSATLDIYQEYPKNPAWQNLGSVLMIEEDLKKVINPNIKIEKLAEGFQFTEGPVWHPDGYLLFSDPNTNVIYKYDPKTKNVAIYMTKSGYAGTDIGKYGQPGSNGLAIDAEGRLIVCQHGNRRVIRHEKKGPITIVSDNYNGKRLNSPNDLVLKSDGTVYFTDPPYGLPNFFNDAQKETPHQGIYMVKNGKTVLLSSDLGGPNGLAFSPDEKYLYVGNWDIRDIHHTKTVWRYEIKADGTLTNGKVFFEMNQTEDEEAIDGIKVDNQGYLFVSAPGGIWIISPEGKYLGKIIAPERPANMAWGDDGKTLYLTAHSGLYKISTLNGGKIAHKTANP